MRKRGGEGNIRNGTECLWLVGGPFYFLYIFLELGGLGKGEGWGGGDSGDGNGMERMNV